MRYTGPHYTTRRTFATTGAVLAGAILAGAAPAVVGAASQVTISHAAFSGMAGFSAAIARRFFADEGLEVNAIVAPADNGPQVAQGTIHATHAIAWTLVPPFLASGLSVGDLVATAGVQRGGIALVVPPSSPIRTIADLRGQKVAAAPFWRVMLSRPLSELGMDPLRDVDWQAAMGAPQASQALLTGEVAAASIADPLATTMEAAGTVRILTKTNSGPLAVNYCCALVMGSALVRSDRAKAVAITRAVARGYAWADANKAEAGRLQVQLGHVTGSPEDNARAALTVNYMPAAAEARRNALDRLMDAQRFGFVDPSFDVLGAVDRIFLPIAGEPAAILRLPATGNPGGDTAEGAHTTAAADAARDASATEDAGGSAGCGTAEPRACRRGRRSAMLERCSTSCCSCARHCGPPAALVNDGIRDDHKAKLVDFIKTSDATSAADLSSRVSGAVERMADGLANDVSGSSLPGAHAAVWALKQGSQ